MEISNLRTSIILLRSRDFVFGGMPNAESYLLHESTVNKNFFFFMTIEWPTTEIQGNDPDNKT